MSIVQVPIEHADRYRRAGYTDLSSLLQAGMSQPMTYQSPATPAARGSSLAALLLFLLFCLGVGAGIWVLIRHSLAERAATPVDAATMVAAVAPAVLAPTPTPTIAHPSALPETMTLCCDGVCHEYASRREVYALAERMGGWARTQQRCNIVGMWWAWQDQMDWYAAHP